MSDKKLSNIVLVKHLPPELSLKEKQDLLKCFGANDVRVMSSKGQLRNAAFATFSDTKHASGAIKRLHQLEVLGYVLSAEHARTCHKLQAMDEVETSVTSKPSVASEKEYTKPLKKCAHCKRLPPIAPHFGIEYYTNPKLKYKYPEPNSDILLNICGALLTTPKLYTQVLHLMNKMNLFPPFTTAMIPPILQEKFSEIPRDQTKVSFDAQLDKHDPCDMSESESEIESEENGKELDIPPPERVRKSKKRKLPNQVLSTSPKRKLSMLKTVLSNQDNIDKVLLPKSTAFPEESEVSGVRKTISMKVPLKINVLIDETNTESSSEGFGKIIPSKNEAQEGNKVEGVETNVVFDFITEKQLEDGRLSSKQRSDNSLFKGYKLGEPSCRLYVKNLPKKATDKDMKFIFGAFVDFSNEDEAKMFDVRVMTQGRMKGQAFIGMPSVDSATKALQATNGYTLIGKPMIVMYARSNKPKKEN
nr:RNA-binding protein 40 [Ciona intestinalis]|eukprot:XP_002121929.1 RNA-binding protein 40 [Ciona intestinalis]